MIRFIDEHQDRRSGELRWGIEPIAHVLGIAPSTYHAAKKRLPSARAVRDAELKPQILRVWEQNLAVYGADKVWHHLNHEDGVRVARCTVERLMADMGLQGCRRGRVWVRTTDFDDDKDRVYVRSTGAYTYYAADCAYYLDKRERGFDKVVIMLGADHHGYIGRLRAMAASFGDNPDETLEILIGQLVNLVRNGEPVRMSKRAGTVVNLEDLVDAIGADAARYALARASVDQTIDLDLDA